MSCLRTDLVFSDYFWSSESKPQPDSDAGTCLFNRRDGHQMLALLNGLSASWLSVKTADFSGNLEKVIRQLVPARMVTVFDVRNWVESNTPRL